MSANALFSASMSSIVLDACWWIWVPCVLRRSAVPAIIADVVVLIASILSSTIFWWASARATVTATCSALMVTSRARSTPRIELTVVADDDLDRQHALLVDRQLLLQVERALAQREEDVLLDELAARVVRADLGGELVDHGRVERLGERDLVGQRVGQFAHLLLVVAERDVVALELVAPLLQRLHDRVDLGLRALVAHEVPLERGADAGNPADQPA